MYRNKLGMVAGLMITSGLFIQAGRVIGDDKGAAPEVSLSVKSELARKLFFGFDLKAGIRTGGDSKEIKAGDKGPDKKDIDWVPDTVMPAVNQGQPLPPMQQLAVNYKILLNRQGYISQVPESFVFQSGDQFRLIFQSNAPAKVQILNKGTSGAGKVLFPDARINNGAHSVPAYQECAIPALGWFQFDNKPGTEELVIIVTGEGAPPPPAAQTMATVCTPGATITVQNWGQVDVAISNHNKSIKAGKTKDIVLVDEGQSVIPMTPVATPPAANPPGGLTPVNPPTSAQMPTQTVITYAATTTVEQTAPMIIQSLKLNHK